MAELSGLERCGKVYEWDVPGLGKQGWRIARMTEINATRGQCLETLRLHSARLIHAAAFGAGHVLEHSGPMSEIVQFGQRVQHATHAHSWVIEEDLDQPVRFGKRERAQQHRVDDAENGGIRPHPQSERQHRHES